MKLNRPTKSQLYGYAQTLVLCGFAASVLLSAREPLLFSSQSAAVTGNVLCAAGTALLLTAVFWLRRVIQIAPNPIDGGELVTSGVYRWLRHPIYTAMIIATAGFFLRQPALPVGATGSLVVAFLLVKSRYEEALLTARYAGYAEYRKTSWGILPGLHW